MKKSLKEAIDEAARELSQLSPEEFAKRMEEAKNSDMLPFIREHVAATMGKVKEEEDER